MPSLRSNISGCVVVPVEAPCDVVFETLCDLDKYASIIPDILKIEVLLGSTIPQVGAKWKETRIFQGQEVETVKAIREYTENPTSITTDISWENANRWDTRNGNQSMTITVEPTEQDPRKCRMIFTIGYVADGIVVFLMTRVFGYCIKRYRSRYLHEEMELFAAEAEKRYRESKASG